MIITDPLEQALHDLRERGHHVTSQRRAILSFLQRSKEHPSAEAIYEQLLPAFPNMSLATVYKTVAILKAAGHILELETGGCSHYDGNPAPHPHLVCTECLHIIDLPEEELMLPAEALARIGFVPLQSSLIIYGLCAECRRAPAAEDDSC